jgi:hypothetical protein
MFEQLLSAVGTSYMTKKIMEDDKRPWQEIWIDDIKKTAEWFHVPDKTPTVKDLQNHWESQPQQKEKPKPISDISNIPIIGKMMWWIRDRLSWTLNLNQPKNVRG